MKRDQRELRYLLRKEQRALMTSAAWKTPEETELLVVMKLLKMSGHGR